MFITIWKKDAVALRENLWKALEMLEKSPKNAWNKQVRMCLTNAVKYLAKGKLHGQDSDSSKPSADRVAETR